MAGLITILGPCISTENWIYYNFYWKNYVKCWQYLKVTTSTLGIFLNIEI